MKKRSSCVVGMFVCVCSGKVQPFGGPAEVIYSGWCAVIMAMYVVNLYTCVFFPQVSTMHRVIVEQQEKRVGT